MAQEAEERRCYRSRLIKTPAASILKILTTGTQKGDRCP
jgi:hypothetical protein